MRTIKTKKYTKFYLKIRSRHPSHNVFRKAILLPFKCVWRLGSTTESSLISKEINNVNVARISGNKKIMKEYFDKAEINTPVWTYNESEIKSISQDWKYSIVAKSLHGSKGKGNTLINNNDDFQNWKQDKNLNNYIFEKFYNYNKEYRLHVTKDGCFYACRKMLKKEHAHNKNAWQRHNDNCVWILEENPQFEKPSCWKDIVNDCVKALVTIEADVLAFDVKVTNENEDNESTYVILECNSAPSCDGDIVTKKYLEEIPKIALKKYNNE